MSKMLHVGCGGDPKPQWATEYEEVRLDISPDNQPDILASMTDMGDIGSFNALFCCHSLEHLSPREVPLALREFHRVLEPGGFVVIVVPDLEGVEANEDVLYEAPCGPITGLDLIYGVHYLIPHIPHMEHRSGFTVEPLRRALESAGFSRVEMKRMGCYNLMAVAIK